MKCKGCGSEVSIKLAKGRGGTDMLVVECPKHGIVANYKLREYDVSHWPPEDAEFYEEKQKEWKT